MKRPVIVFAPGAGAPSSSGWMRAWAGRLAALGEVMPFDYPYQRAGKRRPDLLPQLIEAHREVIAAARKAHGDPIVLAGKSMGSRVGCHASLVEEVAALVCFGYPLVSASSGALRDKVLLELKTPVLFVQGTRDKLCPLELLEPVRARMTAPQELHIVETGDHSLQVFKKTPQAPVDEAILSAVRAFLSKTP